MKLGREATHFKFELKALNLKRPLFANLVIFLAILCEGTTLVTFSRFFKDRERIFSGRG